MNTNNTTRKMRGALQRLVVGLALALGLFVTAASAQQLISNGSFEVGSPAPGNSGQLAIAAGDTANLPGWTASTGMGWYFRATAWGMTAPDGAMLFNLNGQTGIYTLSQSFAVTAGNIYTVSYSELRRGGGGYMDTTVSVAAGAVTGAAGTPVAVDAGPAGSIVQATAVNAAWTLHSFTFTPDTTTTATITFGNHYDGASVGDNDGVFLDNISVLGPAVLTATTTTLTRSSGTVTPSNYGDSLSFDVTVSGSTPTGTVNLFDGGASGTLIGTGTLSAGACTITTTALAVGTHDNIVAVYGGDSSFAPSTSVALSPAQVVNPGPAATLLFTTPPSDAQPGEVWATQPTVKVLDAAGNIANSNASITLAITTLTPASGGPGTLIGTKTVAAVNGVATFSGLSIDTAGVGYRLTATSTDLTPADSALFTISSGTVLYGTNDCSGQFPRTTLDFTPTDGHVYTLSFSLNNPDASLNNCLIGFSPYAQADNTYDDGKLIDGFWVSGTWLGNGSVRRNYNGGIVEESFTTAGSGNGYWGTPGELDSNFEVVLDTTSWPWTTVTSMSSGLGTVSGSVLDAVGTAKSVQVWVRDPGNGLYPTISNFRLTESALVPQANILSFGPGAVINQATLTIVWTVANGTDVKKLAPEFTLSAGATCTVDGNPVVSGAQLDFTSSVHYVVSSSAPVITRDYTVTVKVLPQLALPVTAGVTVWLDASQLTGLTDGDPVATWTDMSGWDNNATASGGSPTYKTGVLNGNAVVQFVKANGDAFTTANLSSQFPAAATVFIVATINPGSYAYTLVTSLGNPTDEWFRYAGNGYGDGMSYPGTFRSSRIDQYCAMPDSGSQLFAISSSATAWEMWINGTNQGVAGGAYSAGGAQVVGSGSNGGTLDGDIAEIIEFNRALDATELNQIGSYLANKYGLTTAYPPLSTTPTATLTITPDGAGNVTIGGTVTPPTTPTTGLTLWKSNDLSLGATGWSDTLATPIDDGGGKFHFFPPRTANGPGTDGTKTFYKVK